MVLTISDDVKAQLERSGSEIVWKADFYLGPFAYLRVADIANGTGDSFTLEVYYSGSWTTRTYAQGIAFYLGADEAACAANMATAINEDSAINDRVSAFAFQSMVVVQGVAVSSRVQASPAATRLAVGSSDAAAWFVQFDPIDDVYTFVSSSSQLVGTTGAIPEIARIENVSAQIDVMSRAFSIGSVEIHLEDGDGKSVARDILTRAFPRGKQVRLSFGTPSMDSDDYVPAGAYVIADVVPSRGMIRIDCEEIPSILTNASFDNRNLPIAGVRQHASSSGSHVVVTIGVTWPSGSSTVTFTEGSEWTGDAVASVAMANLAAAINASSISAYASALLSLSASSQYLYVEPVAAPTVGSPEFADRSQRISVTSSNGSVLTVENLAGQSPLNEWVSPPAPGWTNVHPLSALRDLYRTAGLSAPSIDGDSFDRANYPEISHWGISAHGIHLVSPELNFSNWLSNADKEPRKAIDLQTELCALVQGGPVVTEDGIIRFVRLDVDATATRTLDTDDYADFEWTEHYRNETNSVVVLGIAFGDSTDSRVWLLNASDPGSLSINSFHLASNPDETTVRSAFLGTFSRLGPYPLFDASATQMLVRGAWRSGFPGTRQSYADDPSAAQDAGDELLAGTREAYLVLWNPSSGESEIVKATAAEPYGSAGTFPLSLPASDTRFRLSAGSGSNAAPVMPPSGGILKVYDDWLFTVERAQLGTTAQDFSGVTFGATVWVADVTIAKAVSDHTLRFAFGIPVATFRTGLRHYDLQLGDVIHLDESTFLSTFFDGTGTINTWEIIAKELEFPFVKYTVALLQNSFSRIGTAYASPPELGTATPAVDDGYILTEAGAYIWMTTTGERVMRG